MREKPIKTIIIEDDAEALYLLTTLINSTGMAEVCGSTTDPASATELIRSTDPEMIFLDIRMPHISGLDIARELKESGGKSLISSSPPLQMIMPLRHLNIQPLIIS